MYSRVLYNALNGCSVWVLYQHRELDGSVADHGLAHRRKTEKNLVPNPSAPSEEYAENDAAINFSLINFISDIDTPRYAPKIPAISLGGGLGLVSCRSHGVLG
jgi:hypothetical protein